MDAAISAALPRSSPGHERWRCFILFIISLHVHINDVMQIKASRRSSQQEAGYLFIMWSCGSQSSIYSPPFTSRTVSF